MPVRVHRSYSKPCVSLVQAPQRARAPIVTTVVGGKLEHVFLYASWNEDDLKNSLNLVY